MENNRIGVFDLIGICFIVLKITGFIDWSWWYVTMPFWGVFILSVLAAVLLKIHYKQKKPKSRFKEILELKIKQSKEDGKQRKL